MRIHTHAICGHCMAYDQTYGGCREEGTERFGGGTNALHPACSRYTAAAEVYRKRKKWFKAKSMEDMDDPRARCY